MYVCVDRPRHGKYNTITVLKYKLLLLLHPLNGLFFRTTWISRYRKGKTSRDLNDAKDDGAASSGSKSQNSHHKDQLISRAQVVSSCTSLHLAPDR